MNLNRIKLERQRLKAQSSRIPLGTHDCPDCTRLTFNQLQQIAWKLSNRMKAEQVAVSLGVPTSCVEAINSTMPRKER